jgi:hypothetical protein
MTEALRTPDGRFAGMPGDKPETRYLEDRDGLEWVDEGAVAAPCALAKEET